MSKIKRKRQRCLLLRLFLLLLFLAALYVYGRVSESMDKIEQPVLEEERIVVNDQAPQMSAMIYLRAVCR